MLLEGKNAIVYGGSGAVGGAVARAFAREGARVVLAGRTAATLEAVAEDIRGAGGDAAVATVDALDPAAIDSHLAEAGKTAPINLMFNAISWADTQGTPLTEMEPDHFLRASFNALTTWFLTGTALARHMKEHGGGVILGITANAAKEAYPMIGGFGVACAAVEHYLRQLGVENGQYGARVGWVRSAGSPDAPGVREAWTLRAKEQGTTLAEVEREFAARVPLRRLPVLADVADAAVLLASDHARAMTSTFMNVTCGSQVD